ncbi:hypothetical protein L6164_028528 [Bauhinia variegata]|uniref:Uncharacterized protein n=1 Tax=Bauhinia variegata TaxID=167791 RepID=A0ACB9L680_BAUVA|nr:hypothetical protein L6164_028528 [Bauhinia variegata]
MLKHLGCKLEIVYKLSLENKASDAPSRVHEARELNACISYPIWLEEDRLNRELNLLKIGSSSHLETNGQTEVLNRCLEAYLDALLTTQKLALGCLGRSFGTIPDFKELLEKSPFEVVYGRKPPYYSDFFHLRLRQHSVVRWINQELAARFYSPFQVNAKLGEVTYKLKLPAQSRVHEFHVS